MRFIVLVLLAACAAPTGVVPVEVTAVGGSGPRVLCVVAHPDDELAFSGTLYKTATYLGGACDLAVITNGEGGYKYSTLAEQIYGVPLTDPEVGRSELPAIRQRELVAAARVLGIRRVFLFGQQDHRFTLDAKEVLAPGAGVWDLDFVRDALRRILGTGDYDFVLTHLPVVETHGHHKAASFLAVELVAELPVADRPVVLGAFGSGRDEETPNPRLIVTDDPGAKAREDVGPFVFDRAQKFGFKNRLDYQIVVNWAIAEHRSQGTFQKLMNRWNLETFYVYRLDVPDAPERARRWFERLAEPQFAELDYDENGGRQDPVR